MKGLEVAKMQPNSGKPDVQKVLSYLQVVEEVKHLSDQQNCARLLEVHKLPIGVVPHTLHKSAEVSDSPVMLAIQPVSNQNLFARRKSFKPSSYWANQK